jgi:hypothetical protein
MREHGTMLSCPECGNSYPMGDCPKCGFPHRKPCACGDVLTVMCEGCDTWICYDCAKDSTTHALICKECAELPCAQCFKTDTCAYAYDPINKDSICVMEK